MTGDGAVHYAVNKITSQGEKLKSTVINIKVNQQGITLTDNNRKYLPHYFFITVCLHFYLYCDLLSSFNWGSRYFLLFGKFIYSFPHALFQDFFPTSLHYVGCNSLWCWSKRSKNQFKTIRQRPRSGSWVSNLHFKPIFYFVW